MIARPFTRRSARQRQFHPLLAALVALALIGLARPAAAQTPAQPPSPAAILVAKQIVELKGARQLFTPLVRGVVEKVKDQFMQTNFMWAKDLNEVAASLEKGYAPRVDELVDMAARIYASHFTEAELKQLLAFYQTPVGRKAITEEPKALDESMASGGNWGDALADEVVVKIRDEMKKRGHDL
ncbi:MAG TPA: DUF2059 domain-containing protein [Xanthobacteraceae bacterium]|jgi:hypothetical protein|nr:DUF2059 domain-containing protein [Xanthobacteraceae bacterium]